MGLYQPGALSGAELRRHREEVAANAAAIGERWRKADEEKDRKEREAANAVEAAKRKAEADAKAEAELAEVTALVADPVALVRLVLALKADLSKRVLALEGKRDRKVVNEQASVGIGQFETAEPYGQRAKIDEPTPQYQGWNEHYVGR